MGLSSIGKAIGGAASSIGAALGTGTAGWAVPLIGAGLGYMGTQDQNKAQKKAAREQMAFQERMSSTAYQRAVTDLAKAGLNPILAGKVGGASSPAGAQPNIRNLMEGVSAGISSARDVVKTPGELDVIQRTADNLVQVAKTGRADEFLKSAQRAFTSLSYNEKLLTMEVLREQIKIAQRDGEIAGTTAGKILRWIREARESIIGGSTVSPYKPK